MLRDFDFAGSIVQWLNDYAPQGIVTTDCDLIIRGWNRWLEHSTGRSADSVIGAPLFEVLPELVERGLDHFYHEALQGHVNVLAQRFHQYFVKLPAATEYNLTEMQQSARIAPLMNGSEVVGTITSIEDVSERVVRESELVSASEAADKANQAKDRFLAVLSHDLRTPLTSILGWARVLASKAAQEETVRKGADVIARNVTVQLQLIEQVLDVSRITAAKLELGLEDVDVRDLIVSTLEGLEPLAEAKGIRVERALPPKQQKVAIDPKRFQQIIWNLFSNAVKFTPAGGWIRTTLRYRENGFELTIADSGKGIRPENMPHLFEPLWQAEESRGQHGLGLGLAIVKNLVELHGGCIRAESAGIDRGALFIVEIPWSPPQVQSDATANPTFTPSRIRKARG